MVAMATAIMAAGTTATTVTVVVTMMTMAVMMTVAAAAVAATATKKTTVAIATKKSTENNQIKEAIVTEMTAVMETAKVTVMAKAVTCQQRQQRQWQQQQHIEGVVCLMRKQYFGCGGDWQGHASSHFPAAHITLKLNRRTFGGGWVIFPKTCGM